MRQIRKTLILLSFALTVVLSTYLVGIASAYESRTYTNWCYVDDGSTPQFRQGYQVVGAKNQYGNLDVESLGVTKSSYEVNQDWRLVDETITEEIMWIKEWRPYLGASKITVFYACHWIDDAHPARMVYLNLKFSVTKAWASSLVIAECSATYTYTYTMIQSYTTP